MPPLPLLRLPQLVLCEIFKSFNIGEKIKLSFCSKKLSTQINNAQFYSQKVIVDLDILNQNIRVHSENNKDSFEIYTYPGSWNSHNSNTHQYPIAGCSAPVITTPTGIKIFWKNYPEGFLSVIQYLLKIFYCKISTTIDHHNSDIYQPVISELFHLQLEFKKITISLDGSEQRNLLWNKIASNLRLVEELRIISVENPHVRPVVTYWPEKISVTSFYWFQSLLASTCTRITLDWLHLDNTDLDEILRKWKAGGFPNLEHLKIHGQGIKDIGATILEMHLWELAGMVIEADDGSKNATIRIDTGSVEMSVTSFQ
ncbi:hypothetical protein CRE_13774 [Caenorhabditis remanei]|uniref:F-box domain-containing protein n=1 Tax=Caenorhabditis remanei TaxID=31234 RepID=E3NK84_CAERE|nr:hypothetical protein CRE_13774 [Caenorhabditis remanei]